MTEMTTAEPSAHNDSPMMPQHRPLLPGVNVGAVSIEVERAIAEARGQMQLAKMFPRDVNAAYAELMDSCKQPAMAQAAFYSVPRGGQQVTGPSIRLAEEIARVYGNFEFGHRELSRGNGKSEVEVYAWDKQANNRSIRQITVAHVIDTRQGPKPCRDQAEIDALIANKASKQVRGRILALVPKWLEAAAIDQCKKTLAGGSDKPISQQVREMTQAFARFGVTVQHIEKYLERGSLDECTLDDLVELRGVFQALREGAKVADYFGPDKAPADAPAAPAMPPANDNQPAAAHPAAGRRARQQAAPAAEPAPAATTAATAPATQEPESSAPAPKATTRAAPARGPAPASPAVQSLSDDEPLF